MDRRPTDFVDQNRLRDRGSLTSMEVFDPESNTCSAGPDMSTARCAFEHSRRGGQAPLGKLAHGLLLRALPEPRYALVIPPLVYSPCKASNNSNTPSIISVNSIKQ